jgi:hypothetical protein
MQAIYFYRKNMSQNRWFTSIFLEFNSKILLVRSGDDLILPECSVEPHSRVIDSLALNTEIQTGIAIDNPDLIGIYLHLLPNEIVEYHFLFHQQLTDWDVVKLKLRSDQLPPIRFLDLIEINEWKKSNHSNLTIAKLNQFLSLNTNQLQYHIVRN